MDITPYIVAKSDQLNADDLIAGPITVRISRIARGDADQPVHIHIDGGHMPWKPAKTALRMLSYCWGRETDAWVGRWVRLYCDPDVTWAGKRVGGVRPSHLSHIDKPQDVTLTVRRGKKETHTINVLTPHDCTEPGAPTADLNALLDENGLARADVDAWLASKGKGPLDGSLDKESSFAVTLAGKPQWLEEMRELRSAKDRGDHGGGDDVPEPPMDW